MLSVFPNRCVLGLVLRWYFWLLFALQEAKLSLKRLRALVFGERPKKRTASLADILAGSAGDAETRNASTEAALSQAQGNLQRASVGTRRPGHGRQDAEAYVGAERVVCRHTVQQ